jgi:hypothetical protein
MPKLLPKPPDDSADLLRRALTDLLQRFGVLPLSSVPMTDERLAWLASRVRSAEQFAVVPELDADIPF